MIKKGLYIVFPILLVFLFAFAAAKINNQTDSFMLQSKQQRFIAGKPITLSFSSTSKTAKPKLFLIHTYGKTVLDSQNNNGQITFKIPAMYCLKTGVLSWYLIQNETNGLEANKLGRHLVELMYNDFDGENSDFRSLVLSTSYFLTQKKLANEIVDEFFQEVIQ